LGNDWLGHDLRGDGGSVLGGDDGSVLGGELRRRKLRGVATDRHDTFVHVGITSHAIGRKHCF
jgi:hypothetical protein